MPTWDPLCPRGHSPFSSMAAHGEWAVITPALQMLGQRLQGGADLPPGHVTTRTRPLSPVQDGDAPPTRCQAPPGRSPGRTPPTWVLAYRSPARTAHLPGPGPARSRAPTETSVSQMTTSASGAGPALRQVCDALPQLGWPTLLRQASFQGNTFSNSHTEQNGPVIISERRAGKAGCCAQPRPEGPGCRGRTGLYGVLEAILS